MALEEWDGRERKEKRQEIIIIGWEHRTRIEGLTYLFSIVPNPQPSP